MYSNLPPPTEHKIRGRGRGRGGSSRGRAQPSVRGVQSGRHSSYVPSNSRATPQNLGQRSATPNALPRNGRPGSVVAPPNAYSPNRNQAPVATNSSVAPSRVIPKFSDVSVEDEPTPPPRTPPTSPRIANLPKLPPRPGSTPQEVPVEEKIPEESVSVEKEKKRAALRHKCLEEIYQTEKDYIDDVETLISVFIFPLRAMQILDDNSLKNIFSNVEVLINCNREMLDQLEKAIQTTNGGDDITIGHVFTQLADYFKMYKGFCANQQTSLSTVELLTKKNQQFKKKLDVCHTDARCRGLFLQSFLIKPIQRVCKYPLLLRELIKYTPESHPDWEPLQSAFSKINGVVADINEAQRQAEGLQRILDLTKMIDGVDSLVSPGRNYVKEGELTFYRSQKSKNGETRHVFFFSDLILLTNRKGEKRFDHKLSVGLDTCKLVVLADSSHIKNAFELQTGNKKQKCILSGSSAAESNLWIKEIRGLIKSYQKKKLREVEEQKKKGLTPIHDSL